MAASPPLVKDALSQTIAIFNALPPETPRHEDRILGCIID
jgi:hypothetical protein